MKPKTRAIKEFSLEFCLFSVVEILRLFRRLCGIGRRLHLRELYSSSCKRKSANILKVVLIISQFGKVLHSTIVFLK